MNKPALKNTALPYAHATAPANPRGVAAGMVAAHWLWSIMERDECEKAKHRMAMDFWQLQVTK